MKIIRHTARDMRQALRAVREQLGEDAVILSSRRTGEGVEITAAVDFDASTLEAGGFTNSPALPPVVDATFTPAPTPAPRAASAAPASRASIATNPTVLALTTQRAKAQAAPQPAAPEPAPSYDQLASLERLPTYNLSGDDADWISDAAREAVAKHVAAPRAPVLAPALVTASAQAPAIASAQAPARVLATASARVPTPAPAAVSAPT